jgi:hypothetical protein
MIKKIISYVILMAMLSIQSVAITQQELGEQIQRAYMNLQRAELKLKLRAPHLADFWMKEFTNEDGHQAELELRRMYPKEYHEYVSAKIDLDDLLYTQFLMFANGGIK